LSSLKETYFWNKKISKNCIGESKFKKKNQSLKTQSGEWEVKRRK